MSSSPGCKGDRAQEDRRLLWRCRRGMKELDVLLERYAQAALPQAGEPERQAFIHLLTLPDPLLSDYLLHGIEPEDPPLAQLVRRILATSACWQSGRGSGIIEAALRGHRI